MSSDSAPLTIGQVRGWGISLLHLSRNEFYMMRLDEFWEAMDAHNKEVEADRRHMGELVRGATLRLFNLQIAKKDRFTDPAKFWRMPWDEISTADEELERFEAMTDDERAENAKDFLNKIGW